jgi:hypothetical protein
MMNTRVVNGYEVAGNEFLAITISLDNPEDVHWFTRDLDCHDDAFKRAVAWAGPGLQVGFVREEVGYCFECRGLSQCRVELVERDGMDFWLWICQKCGTVVDEDLVRE